MVTQTPGTESDGRARRRLADPASASAQSSYFGGPPSEVSRLTSMEHTGQPDDEGDGALASPKRKGRRGRLPEPLLWVIDIAVWVVAAIILSTLLRLFVFQMFLVPSQSMENTLQKNDRIAALKLAHFQRGDIVVFADPGGWLTEPATPVGTVHKFLEKIGLLANTDQQYLVKRAIGLPGDHVKCCTVNGRITVNGVELDESLYLKEPNRPASEIEFDIIVPAGHIFVMGDNRYNSADSRYHLCEPTDQGLGMNAFVPLDNIVGPVRAVILPFGRTGHRALPTSVFKDVPAPVGAAPAVASISVTSGLPQTCQS